MSNLIQIRPKYNIPSNVPPDLIAHEVNLMLEKSKLIRGRIINNVVYLKLADEQLQYWSPELQVKIKRVENGSLIKGIAGPNPKVWATFMVFYGLSVMILIFGGSLGISQRMLGIDSFWIWSVPISVVLFAIIFFAAKYGQRLGADQLLLLRGFLDDSIERAEKKQNTFA